MRKLESLRNKKRLESLQVKDRLSIEVYRDNKLLDRRETEDLIVNVGKAHVAGLINGVTTTPFKYVALGTLATVPPLAGQTALQAETHRILAQILDRTTTTVTNDTARIIAEFTMAASFALVESGVFDSPSAGVMLARQTFAPLNVVSGDIIIMRWNIQVA